MNLPAPVQELWNVWREIEGKARHTVMVNLVGPIGEQRENVRKLLTQGSPRPGSLRVLELTGDVVPEADMHLVMIDPAFGPTTAQLKTLHRIEPAQLIVILLGGDETQFEGRRREVATAIGLRMDQVLTAAGIAELRPRLARRVIQTGGEYTVALAKQFPFLREEAADQEMQDTAKQNALVGAIPVPGADMPIMTANQIKMVLRLAAIYDQPMTAERLKEVTAVVGGGFALRTAARQVAKFIPGPGWVVGGALGYAGTFAMGKAAIEYFKRSTEPQLPRPSAP
ncbi:MAG: YcjF family protein, partial [Candidatus Sericytochromatia bacterium]